MIAKQVIRAVLIIVVLGGLAVWANREFQKKNAVTEAAARPPTTEAVPTVAGNQVVMTYFISGTRCESCKKIEDLARLTANKDFAADFASNKLVFRVIDTGEPANRHFEADYKLASKTLVLSHRVDGRETEWVAMEKVWDLLDDPEGYRAYLAKTIRAYLGHLP